MSAVFEEYWMGVPEKGLPESLQPRCLLSLQIAEWEWEYSPQESCQPQSSRRGERGELQAPGGLGELPCMASRLCGGGGVVAVEFGLECGRLRALGWG